MFTWTTIAQILWTSFATASYYVLFAVAFSLVLKVNGVFNFAQAGLMTVAFYAAHASIAWGGLGGPMSFAAALAATLVGAWGLEHFGFATMRRNQASPMFVFIFTIVTSEFISYLAMLLFGTWPKTIFPQLFWPVTLVGDIAVSAWDVPALLSASGAVAPGERSHTVVGSPAAARLRAIAEPMMPVPSTATRTFWRRPSVVAI